MKPESNLYQFVGFLSFCAVVTILYYSFNTFKNYKDEPTTLDLTVQARVYSPGDCVQYRHADKEEWEKPKEDLVYLILERGKRRYRSLAGFPSQNRFIETYHSFWMIEEGMEAVECPEMFRKISEQLKR